MRRRFYDLLNIFPAFLLRFAEGGDRIFLGPFGPGMQKVEKSGMRLVYLLDAPDQGSAKLDEKMR